MLGKVSLITPCYNGERYIQLYIDNIRRQDYSEVEVIFVNDGSTYDIDSEVIRIKEAVQAKGYDFVYLTKENGGAASAVNLALQYVTGDYVMLLDMDDELFEEAISAKAKVLNEHEEMDVVISNGFYIFEDKRRKSCPFIKGSEVVPEKIFENLLNIDFYTWPGSYMVRCSSFFLVNEGREIFKSLYGQNMQILIPATYHKRVFFLDTYLMNYYVRKKSVSHTKDKDRMVELITGYEVIRENVIKKICKDEQEREKYLYMIKVAGAQQKLQYSCRKNDRLESERQYSQLRNLGAVRFYDSVVYLCGKNRLLTFVYRAIIHIVERVTNRVI